jgi:hypothetical protein
VTGVFPRTANDRSLPDLCGWSAALNPGFCSSLTPTTPMKCDVASARGSATLARDAPGWAPIRPWERTTHDVLNDWRGRVSATSGDS